MKRGASLYFLARDGQSSQQGGRVSLQCTVGSTALSNGSDGSYSAPVRLQSVTVLLCTVGSPVYSRAQSTVSDWSYCARGVQQAAVAAAYLL